jgi:chemotaxis protein methyltransferase CheR
MIAPHPIRLLPQEFQLLSAFIYAQCGINITPQKKVLVETRLQKRLKSLSMESFKQYYNYLTSPRGLDEELFHMIDAISTNKTDFFRESVHFDFIVNTVLKKFTETTGNVRPFYAWSAACSSGEEPYTLAMVLENYRTTYWNFDYSILATDISMKALRQGVAAIYPFTRANDIPAHLRSKYLLKSKDKEKPTIKIVPELRKKVTFQRLNLMDNVYQVSNHFDVIFCRNLLIYFDRKTQENVLRKLLVKLPTDGYLFIGHSESLHGLDLPLKSVQPTIYVKV